MIEKLWPGGTSRNPSQQRNAETLAYLTEQNRKFRLFMDVLVEHLEQKVAVQQQALDIPDEEIGPHGWGGRTGESFAVSPEEIQAMADAEEQAWQDDGPPKKALAVAWAETEEEDRTGPPVEADTGFSKPLPAETANQTARWSGDPESPTISGAAAGPVDIQTAYLELLMTGAEDETARWSGDPEPPAASGAAARPVAANTASLELSGAGADRISPVDSGNEAEPWFDEFEALSVDASAGAVKPAPPAARRRPSPAAALETGDQRQDGGQARTSLAAVWDEETAPAAVYLPKSKIKRLGAMAWDDEPAEL